MSVIFLLHFICGKGPRHVNCQDWTLSPGSRPADCPHCLSQLGTEGLFPWEQQPATGTEPHKSPHLPTAHPLESLPRNHLLKERKVTPWSLGDSLMQNPVNHSLRLQRNRIPRDGPIPERHKTLAQGPDFQGNQLPNGQIGRAHV